MAGIAQDTLWKLADMVLKGRSDAKKASEQATFLRTDPDGTQWVRLPGSSGETPVNGRTLAAAMPGDLVQWSVEDGVLSITGNATSPAVGERKVVETVAPVAEKAESASVAARLAQSVAESVEGIAASARAVANAVAQHFWTADDGIHITEVTEEQWEQSHSGANVLLNAFGQLFRDGLNNLLALVGGTNPGVAIYDGAGNDAENIVASFDGDGMTVFNNGLKLMKVGNLGNVYGIASYINDVLTGYIHSISGSINVHGIDATSVTGGSGFQSGLGEVYASAGSVRETLWLNGDSERSPSFERSVTSTGFTERSKTSSNTWSTPAGTVLWSSGGWHMAVNQTANLKYNVSTCPTGIVLHWQPYTSSTVRNYYHHWQFIPKEQVASYAGTTVDVTLSSSKFASIATKTLYVSDNRVTGHADNTASGTANGITYANSQWVLTQIIAV